MFLFTEEKVMFYNTLLGETIDLAKIPTSHKELIECLVALVEKTEMESLGPEKFQALAQHEIWRHFQVTRDYNRAMNGPVGAVYRDCFYRLIADEAPTGERRLRFIKNLRSNPVRILVDDFLAGSDSQHEFAQAAGLDPRTVSRIFDFVLKVEPDESESVGLSLSRFRAVCERLNIVPLAHCTARDDEIQESPWSFAPSNVTLREQSLRMLVMTVTRAWATAEAKGQHVSGNVQAAFLKFVGLHLSALYGVEDIVVLDHMTAAFIKDIESVPGEQALARVLALEISISPEIDQLCLGAADDEARDNVVGVYRHWARYIQDKQG